MRISEIIKTLCKYKGAEILEGHMILSRLDVLTPDFVI